MVLRCSACASTPRSSDRPAPFPKVHLLRRSTVTLHHSSKPFNLSRSPLPPGNSIPSFACTTESAFSTAVRIVFDVLRRELVLLAVSILCWISGGSSSRKSWSSILPSPARKSKKVKKSCKCPRRPQHNRSAHTERPVFPKTSLGG